MHHLQARRTGNYIGKDARHLRCSRGSGRTNRQIVGSGNLIQSLQAASLIDEYIVWTFPVILGHGKRLFETTAKPGALRLISTQASRTGVVMSTYVPAGDIPLGSFAQTEPSEKELDRRAKMAHEDQ